MRTSTTRTAALGSMLAAGLLCLGVTTVQAQCPAPRPAPAGPGLWIQDQSIASGTTSGSISVSVAAASAMIAGTQSDITFPSGVVVAAKSNGKPDCTVSANLTTPSGASTDKSATSFAFRPNGCGGTSGTACTAVRALVLATDNTDALASQVLFTCNITVSASASGNQDLTFSGVILSDPNGAKVTDAGDQDGLICISGGTTNPTPTPVVAACPSPRAAPAGPGLWIPDQSLAAGATSGTISVNLAAATDMIAGTQSDIAFPTNAVIAAKSSGKPDCTVNANLTTPSGAATDKSATSFAFRPNGCGGTSGVACTAVRALVLATDNTDPLASQTLFTCNITVGTGASGTLDYTFSGVILSDPNGVQITDTGDQDGAICISGGTTNTPTPAAACPTARPSPTGPGLWIPDQSLAAGATSGTISVDLAAATAMIAGTQSDIAFPTNAVIAAKSSGKPDCTVNANLVTPSGAATDKSATSFAFRPNGCGGTSGTACTAVRALVLATDNTDALASQPLFTCNITVSAGASGTLDYSFSGVILSDPNGGKVTDAGDQDGEICIQGAVGPSPTPTSGGATCAAARPAPAGPGLWIPDQSLIAGTTSAVISVTLAANTAQVAGTQSDIAWNPAVSVINMKSNGKPDCTVNPNLVTPSGAPTDKSATSFAFRPNGCSGATCTAVRALVLATDNTDALASQVLFTCNVTNSGTPGTSDYTFSGVILSDPNGVEIPDAGDQDGLICIPGGLINTPTSVPTSSPSPTNTPIPTVAAPTATATNTAQPTATRTAVGPITPTPSTTIEDEGGCQIGTTGHHTGGWLLVVPLVGLLVLRRRRS